MTRGATAALAAAALAGAAMLAGCSTQANLLAAIDGPYVSPSERAAMTVRAAPSAPQPEEVASAPPALVSVPEPQPQPDPLPVAAPTPAQAAAAPVTPAIGGLSSSRIVPAADGTYAPFFAHALARLEQASPARDGKSMLLADPPSLEPVLRVCGNRPPAVLIDLDPATGLLPLASTHLSDPALAQYLARLRDEGVGVNWITGHTPDAAGAIRAMLRTTGLDPEGLDALIVSRFAGESKQDRRMALGETQCLLAIAGDSRSDFDELYDFLLEPVLAAPLEELVGNGWFLAPPPID